MSTHGYNKCVWVGNLIADPELRTTGAGAPLLIFRITVTRTYSSNGQTPDDTQYFRAIRWGKTAAAADSYRVQGNRVLVEGRLENRQYTDPATRQEHRFTAIVCRERVYLGGRRGAIGPGDPGSSRPGAEPPLDAVVPG